MCNGPERYYQRNNGKSELIFSDFSLPNRRARNVRKVNLSRRQLQKWREKFSQEDEEDVPI